MLHIRVQLVPIQYGTERVSAHACARKGRYFLRNVDFFFNKTSSNSGVARPSTLNSVKIGLEVESDDDEDVDDAEEVERDVTICGGAYCCGIGATSGVGGGSEGGFCVYVKCAEGTPCAYFDGRGGSGITLLV